MAKIAIVTVKNGQVEYRDSNGSNVIKHLEINIK
jgi:hypothetical protein